ncbi:MAG TPA: hypothetical protein VKA07_04175 [Candidatus Sulfotelmatobacter sp.]|nr:hypothetical protein [Candidatus Sulfotelmatobacter sp.]
MRYSLVFVPLLFAVLGFLSFLRMPGAENVRAVQIVILMATGMCIGVALARLLTQPAKP